MNLLIFNQLLTQLSVHVVLDVANLLEQYVRRRYTMDISRAVKKRSSCERASEMAIGQVRVWCVCVFLPRDDMHFPLELCPKVRT